MATIPPDRLAEYLKLARQGGATFWLQVHSDDVRLLLIMYHAATRKECYVCGHNDSVAACEHGVADGDWCKPCNQEAKRAAAANGD